MIVTSVSELLGHGLHQPAGKPLVPVFRIQVRAILDLPEPRWLSKIPAAGIVSGSLNAISVGDCRFVRELPN